MTQLDALLVNAVQLELFDLRPYTIQWRLCPGCYRMIDARTDAGHWAACITLNPDDPS